ncbi:sel1 repeat family protein, partial [Paracoccaceae bacterium]|nr:sel1 repeat family protein [Paracoccaceae bacterium]
MHSFALPRQVNKMIWKLLIFTFLFSQSLSLANAEVVKRSTQENLFSKVQNLAMSGDPEAQAELGRMYYFGEITEENKTEAVKWYRLAAEQGHVDAQVLLGMVYDIGSGIAKDGAEAVKWYRLAAEQGFAAGQYFLGGMYEFGTGISENKTEAVKWYRRAAEQGDAAAEYAVGRMYEFGTGISENKTEAVKWYRLAAEQGHARAQHALGTMHDFGKGVAENDTEAVEWYRLAANQEYTRSQSRLGDMYYYGYGVPKKMQSALKWYLKAYNNGDTSVGEDIANSYRNLDYSEKSKIWYLDAMGSFDGTLRDQLSLITNLILSIVQDREWELAKNIIKDTIATVIPAQLSEDEGFYFNILNMTLGMIEVELENFEQAETILLPMLNDSFGYASIRISYLMALLEALNQQGKEEETYKLAIQILEEEATLSSDKSNQGLVEHLMYEAHLTLKNLKEAKHNLNRAIELYETKNGTFSTQDRIYFAQQLFKLGEVRNAIFLSDDIFIRLQQKLKLGQAVHNKFDYFFRFYVALKIISNSSL